MSEEPTRAEIQTKVRELLGRATLLRARANPEQAVELVRQALALDRANWETHELLADLLLDTDRFDQAIQSYTRARELNETRGVLEEKIGRAALARAAKRRSAELSRALLEGKPVPSGPRRNPAYAALFSFFVPGLGQVYNGEVLKGLAMVIAYLILFALAGITMRSEIAARPVSPMGSLYGPQMDVESLFSTLFGGVAAVWVGLLLVLWIFSIAEAAIRASKTMTSDDTGLV